MFLAQEVLKAVTDGALCSGTTPCRATTALASTAYATELLCGGRSIDTERRFTTGCWQAARLFHRRRLLGATEDGRERDNSVMSWAGHQNIPTAALVDRLRLRASGCRFVGSLQNANVVEAVVAVHSQRLKPVLGQHFKRAP